MRQNNPYGKAVPEDLSPTEQALYRLRFKHQPQKQDKVHIVTEWDNLWDIAFDNYGDGHYYFIIADINNLESPLELPPVGSSIIIPELTAYQPYL